MSGYLLDSGPLGSYFAGRQGAHAQIEPWVTRREAVTSILAYGEVIEYLKGRTDYDRRRDTLRWLMLDIYPYTLGLAVMEWYAELRRQLRPPRGPGLIGDVDTLIAATAIAHDRTLVTIDADFQRVPGLKLMLLARDDLR